MSRMCWPVFLAAALAASFPTAVLAQTITATISGTVKDDSGAIVPGATVTLTHVDTGRVRSALSNAQGRYHAPNLPVGSYRVECSLPGFTTEVRSGITLTVGQHAIVDFALSVGEISEVIEVSGQPPLVERTSSEVGGLVEQQAIEDLPLNGRDLTQLMGLQAGVTFNRNANQGIQSGGQGKRPVVHGTRETQNLFLMDGTMLNDTMSRSPGGEAGVFIGAEAVREFKVLLHNFSAEYGRAAGGVFNAITKSGTNVFHGSVYEYHRNSALDARNFFDQEEKPAFKRNQFGFSLGGPIVKNQTFFFGNYEGLRDRLNSTNLLIVPSAAGRMGDLGSVQVPVDPVVVPYLDLYPLPNGRIFDDGTGELFAAANDVTDEDYVTVRVDHQLGDNDSLFGRYTFDDSSRRAPFPDRTVEFPQRTQSKRQFVTLEETKIFSPNLLNVIRFGYSRSNTGSVPDPDDPRTDLAFIPGEFVGNIEPSGVANTGTRRQDPRIFILNTFQVTDQVSYSRGAHSFKFGVDFTRFQLNQTDAGPVRGSFRFGSLADFLQARPNRLRIVSPNPLRTETTGERQSLIGLFIQDDFQAGPNLTLNLGLRWEMATIPYEVAGRWPRLDNFTDPEVTIDGRPFVNNPTTLNFAPRIGFAWDPTGSGRSSVRGGFGIFYDPPLSSHWRTSASNSPFRSETVLRRNPAPIFPNAWELQQEFIAGEGATPQLTLMNSRANTMYLMQWSLDVQREILPQTLFSVGYFGHRGIHLTQQTDVNLKTPIILPDGRKFFPEEGEILNPNFGPLRIRDYNADSYYHSLQTVISRRFSAGFRFQASYSFSRLIDTYSLQNRGDGNGDSRVRTLQDVTDNRADRGLSDLHAQHILSVNGSYDLPFWKGTRLGGWQVNTIVTANSGAAYSPLVGFDVDRDGSGSNETRPDRVDGVDPQQGGSVNQYFNPEAFTLQEPGFYGNAGRNILIGPSLWTVDLSLLKNTYITEGVNLQFRAEAFNLFNRANFGLPLSTIFNSRGRVSSAGRLTHTVTTSRQIQFGLKILF